MPGFGQFAPDSYLINADAVAEASGVLPRANSYGPLLQPAVTSLAVPAAVRGAFAARTAGNTISIYAFAAARGYKFAGVNSAWTNITRTVGGDYTLAADNYWSIKQYGTVIIATQDGDVVQFIDVDSGTNLAALAGSPPQSRYVGIIGDFVELAATATNRRAVKWSARNDAANWTAGQKDSDGQTFNDGGDVMGISGFELGGLVFQTDTVRRQSSRQDAAIFEFHRVDAARGTPSPQSIVTDGTDVYYWSNQGWMKFSADGSIVNIGADRINEWFGGSNPDWNKGRPKAIIGALDPIARRIFWLYPKASNASSAVLDGLLCYDIERDRWTHATVALTYIFTAAIPGFTLADIAALYATLSLVPYPFGSDVWKGGAPGLACFDSSNRLCFFAGTPMAATVQTSPFEPVPGSRAFVQGCRLIGDAATAAAKFGGAERPQTAVVFNAAQSVNDQGRVPARISTRFAQVQVDVPAGVAWRDLQGIEFDPNDTQPDGRR